MEQGSEAWHEIRLGRFTGTRLKNLMSGKSTASYKDAIIDVVTEILTGEKDDGYVSADMERGIEMESEAADYYELITDLDTYEVGFCTFEDDNVLAEYSGISPDRLIGDDGMLEIKCPKAKTLFSYIQANKLPAIYRWQVQGQLYITGRKWCDFMAYYPNLKPFIVRVLPDKDMHLKIEEELKIAIQSVKENIKMYNKFNYLKDE